MSAHDEVVVWIIGQSIRYTFSHFHILHCDPKIEMI